MTEKTKYLGSCFPR